MDPDKQVREIIALFFRIFQCVGSARMTVKEFNKKGLLFPRRVRTGARKGELVWGKLCYSRAVQLLHNPRYAGAFFYGRRRLGKQANGKVTSRVLAQDEWHALIPGLHEGYISWEEFEDNQRCLRESAQSYGKERRKSPPREGSALLQGIVLCGICGKRMTVRYHRRGERMYPDYVCQSEAIEHVSEICSRIPGTGVDKAIGDLLLEMLTPMTLEVALAVQQELLERIEDADQIRAKQVERSRYEADLARRRYMKVDPDNRLVADMLEAEWNGKLRALQQAQEEYERQRQADLMMVDEEARERVMELSTDFPKLWKDPETSNRDRKRMVRLLLEDVTLIRQDQICAHVRFKGGATTTLRLAVTRPYWETWKTPAEVVAKVDYLLDSHTDRQIAEKLNEQGLRSGKGRTFHSGMIASLRKEYGLKSRYARLREAGLLTAKEMARKLKVSTNTISA